MRTAKQILKENIKKSGRPLTHKLAIASMLEYAAQFNLNIKP